MERGILCQAAHVPTAGRYRVQLSTAAVGTGDKPLTVGLFTFERRGVEEAGDSSSRANDNLPIVLAGGGFKHQGHVAFDRTNNTVLSNLFVRMLQQMCPANRTPPFTAGPKVRRREHRNLNGRIGRMTTARWLTSLMLGRLAFSGPIYADQADNLNHLEDLGAKVNIGKGSLSISVGDCSKWTEADSYHDQTE